MHAGPATRAGSRRGRVGAAGRLARDDASISRSKRAATNTISHMARRPDKWIVAGCTTPTARSSAPSAPAVSSARRSACTPTRRAQYDDGLVHARRIAARDGGSRSSRTAERSCRSACRTANGVFADVMPGFDTPDDYANDGRFFGALIGRYANRIAGARFTLDGVTYSLDDERGREPTARRPARVSTR